MNREFFSDVLELISMKTTLPELESSQNKRLSISVALCTYNGAKFLQEQLASLLNQTRLPDELVICDDGSTDETFVIVSDFAKSCPFTVRVFVNPYNVGSSKNFEQSIGYCTGDIIALTDQDDTWRPEKLSCIESTFIQSSDLGGVFSNAALIDAKGIQQEGDLWSVVGFGSTKQTAIKNGHGFDVLLLGNFVTGATLAFRASWKGLVLPVPPGWVHDYWIALLVAAASRIDFIDEPLIEYRCHPDQERGVQPGGVAGLWQQFKSLDDTAYVQAAAMRLEVAERLRRYDSSRFSTAIAKCEAMAEHLQRRGTLPKRRSSRIGMIFKETVNGNYFRHSSGLKSILRDLLATY